MLPILWGGASHFGRRRERGEQVLEMIVDFIVLFKVKGEGEGYIVFSRPWPGIMRTVYGDQDRLVFLLNLP